MSSDGGFTNSNGEKSRLHQQCETFPIASGASSVCEKDIYARTLAHSSYRGVVSKIAIARCSKKSLMGTPTRPSSSFLTWNRLRDAPCLVGQNLQLEGNGALVRVQATVCSKNA